MREEDWGLVCVGYGLGVGVYDVGYGEGCLDEGLMGVSSGFAGV